MDKNLEHINPLNQDPDYLKEIPKVNVSFEQTKEDLWIKMEQRISSKPLTSHKYRFINVYKYAVAAVIVILLSSVSVLKFYTKSISTNKDAISVILPDQSEVYLYAQSNLTYHPYWWNFDRSLDFKGEAFFKVQKGKKFKVNSTEGVTEVLGTSFKIYTREHSYNVYCKTGRVKVSSTKSDVNLILKPNDFAILDNQQKKGSLNTTKLNSNFNFKKGEFSFTSKPLTEVLTTLEQHYSVSINFNKQLADSYLYTGNFTKPIQIEKALDLISTSLNIKFVRQNHNIKVLFEE